MSDDRPFPLSGRPPCLLVPDTLCLSACEYGIVGQCARLPRADEDLANIGLSRPCLSRLQAGGVNTVQQARELGYLGILRLPNVGTKYAREAWAAVGGPPETTKEKGVEMTDELDRLRRDCSEFHQVIGYLAAAAGLGDDPQTSKALDNAAAAANGEPRPHDDLLPFTAGGSAAFRKIAEGLHEVRQIIIGEVEPPR